MVRYWPCGGNSQVGSLLPHPPTAAHVVPSLKFAIASPQIPSQKLVAHFFSSQIRGFALHPPVVLMVRFRALRRSMCFCMLFFVYKELLGGVVDERRLKDLSTLQVSGLQV
jgi:hypothetical protein